MSGWFNKFYRGMATGSRDLNEVQVHVSADLDVNENATILFEAACGKKFHWIISPDDAEGLIEILEDYTKVRKRL